MSVVIETTVGDITVDLYTDLRPISCRNFLKLCLIKYYNFSLFHTVQSNFLAQTGDPTGTGNGGESISWFTRGPEAKYTREEKLPALKHDKPGLISMVNCSNVADEPLIGSQFFITLGSDLNSINQNIVFGKVVEGHDVLLKLNEAICDQDNRPYKDIRITHTVILDDPYEKIEGLFIPPFSPKPTEEILQSDRIAADEDIEDENDIPDAEKKERKAAREAKAQATILEIIGDIPDADIAPPENVLFVCKLNPVTNEDDLKMIFTRFGEINCCEVIKDKTSGDSLQYAFIEFKERKSCEEAFFKMDNVLIDDRRIHVDFSQSVSKYKWRGRGKGVQINEDKEEEHKSKMRSNDDRKSSRKQENNHRKQHYSHKSKRNERSRSRSPKRSHHREDRRTEKNRSSYKRRSRSRSPYRNDRRRERDHKYKSSDKHYNNKR